MKFKELRSINVNEKVERKNGLAYLSWSWAWDQFKQSYPDATYEIVKNANGLPYFESSAGAMCYTKVTAEGETHEMWLPVMDGANKAMKSEPYKYATRNGEKTVDAYTMFDVNKTLMRCLVKNLAMFGLALYLYSGEDIPDEPTPDLTVEADKWMLAISGCKSMDELKEIYMAAAKSLDKDKVAIERIAKAKDKKKEELK